MSVELGRPRKLDRGGTDRVLDQFLDQAGDEDVELVLATLQAIGDGSWPSRLTWAYDFNRKLQFVVALRPDLVLIFRLFLEYPDTVVLISIGPPGGNRTDG